MLDANKKDPHIAISYVEAMHDLCKECHHKMEHELKIPGLSDCSTCHKPN
jgi:hypothetical protein